MRKMTVIFLSAVLLLALAGCASGQSAEESEPVSRQPEQLSETEILQKLFQANIIRNILALHENVEENVINYDEQGNELMTIYQYADSNIYVWERNHSMIDIEYPDCYYFYDPDTMDRVVVGIGMENIIEEEWEERWDGSFEFQPDENDEIIDLTESDGHIMITISAIADAELFREHFSYEKVTPGTKSITTVEADAETYLIYEAEYHLEKPDGTEVKVGEYHFSYDVPPYEPSEEMLRVIKGTDKTVTLIADPGTEQEKKYTKSFGENGRLSVSLADGYEKIYEDEACTKEVEPSDENGEKTLYTIKER